MSCADSDPTRRRVSVIAHRGASAEAPESTRAAIERAVRLGADMIELDVQMTKDGRLVVFHDTRLDRTTNGRGWLSQWRYRELARLDAGAWFAPRFSGERVLLLSQVLRLVPRSSQLNLELKRTARKAAVVHRVVRCVSRTGAVRRVLVSSFDAGLVKRMKAAHPRIARALLCRRRATRALRRAIALECVAVHPHASLVTPALVAQAHRAGLRVHAWTVDRLSEARRLIRMGVDGLVTNRPDRLRALRGGLAHTGASP